MYTIGNSNRHLLHSELVHTTPHTNFYESISIQHQLYERLGSASQQEFDLLVGVSVSRCSIDSQMKFIRKVYLITLSQLSLISFMSILFMYFINYQGQSERTWWFLLSLATVFLIIAAWQLWTQYHQLTRLSRAITFAIYSFFIAFIFSNLVSRIFQEYSLIVLIMTCFGMLGVIFYTFQIKFKFQGTKPIVCSIAMICISSIGLREAYKLNPVQILGPITIASSICSYLILELYYAMKDLTVDDYILANLSFHMDLVYPINYLHHLCELSDYIDNFPEYFSPPDLSLNTA
ncbi:uncharacterized protein BX663DRAFT_502181 [Cokeromyces recurvatus]|uniref:uncharacterized protein n=1 Tax=Cokeromyces recurvatus TaxID=90255 RepID=UPI00221EA71C|nr:uncharacterized protein BX663DRAFT_502181 [Cokeromyces recurvatus]KAI7905229.1 hypothetical protein BX663DRAFT_502181 [Cokeromyces recurvatus]